MRADFSLDDATAVVATVGTTGTTSVDPGARAARRCEDAGVWLHVDAAYAGSAAVCPELRWCLDGCDRADSIVVNPHKWLFTPMDCSALWTRRPEVLARDVRRRAATTSPRREDAVDLKDYGPALGRRFRALKLWFVLRWYGAEGLRALIREHVGSRSCSPRGSTRSRVGGVRAASVLDGLLPAPHGATTTSSRAPRRRPGSCSSRRRGFAAQPVIRLAIGNARTSEARRRARLGGVARVRPRAVIFDLWETLIDWDREAAARDGRRGRGARRRRVRGALAALAEPLHGADPGRARRGRRAGRARRWKRCVRSGSSTCGAPSRPRPGAVETLRRLHELGILVGLITVCSEDVEVLWPIHAVRRALRRRGLLVGGRALEAGPADLPALLRAARRRAVRGRVRRRRRERRARGRASASACGRS